MGNWHWKINWNAIGGWRMEKLVANVCFDNWQIVQWMNLLGVWAKSFVTTVRTLYVWVRTLIWQGSVELKARVAPTHLSPYDYPQSQFWSAWKRPRALRDKTVGWPLHQRNRAMGSDFHPAPRAGDNTAPTKWFNDYNWVVYTHRETYLRRLNLWILMSQDIVHTRDSCEHHYDIIFIWDSIARSYFLPYHRIKKKIHFYPTID